MVQASFHHGADHAVKDGDRAGAGNPAGLPLSVSIFADRPHIRDCMRDDAVSAGLKLGNLGDVARFLNDNARLLGDVILLDCPVVDAATLASLMRLDLWAARTDAHLVVSTSIEALDDVFACLDQCDAQILVDPTRADRVIALGNLLTRMPGTKLRELSDEDRLTLLRLTQQVGHIAERLDRLSTPGVTADGGAFRFETPKSDYKDGKEVSSENLVRAARPSLPDPRLVRRIIRQRQLRARFFDAELFGDPAWDIMLDLTAARVEHLRVSVTSLCIASGVPPTTALWWISQMTETGLLERVEDEADRRRAFIALSDKAADAMARYFAELGKDAATLV